MLDELKADYCFNSLYGPNKRILVHKFIALSVAGDAVWLCCCLLLLICMLRVIKPGVELTRSKGMPKRLYIPY